METSSPPQLPDNVDMKPSFRKLSNDAAQRKYRRRSPVGGSGSSPSGGSPDCDPDRDHNPIFQKGESRRMSDDRNRRKEGGRESERDSSRYRGGKDSDYYRHKDKLSYGSSNDYRRHNDYKRNRYKHADEDERSYSRSVAWSVQESRGGMRADHVRLENDHDRHRESRRFMDKYSRESPDDAGYRSRDKDRETTDLWRDRHRDRVHGDKRDHRRSSGDHKNSRPSSYEDSKGHAREITSARVGGLHHSKEAYGTSGKESGERKEEKRKTGDRERDPYKERFNGEIEEHLQGSDKNFAKSKEQDVKSEPQDKSIRGNEYLDSSGKKMKLFHAEKATPAEDADEKSGFSSKPGQDGGSKVTAGLIHSSASVTDTAHDINAAKVAALKAAELVNRNLVGGGYLTTDQKKKLLWGNKKNTSTEESGSRWDATMFPDRERQEKFNKLMSLSLHWCLWPIVGCKRRCKPRAQAPGDGCRRQPPRCREAESAPNGLGEAVYCWTSSTRWQDCWFRIVMFPTLWFPTSRKNYHICLHSNLCKNLTSCGDPVEKVCPACLPILQSFSDAAMLLSEGGPYTDTRASSSTDYNLPME